MKQIIYLIIFILSLISVTAIEQCSYKVYQAEVPCYILLSVNKTLNHCDTINASFYLYTQYESSTMMADYNDVYCYANFTSNTLGIHSIGYSTQDSGSINVVSNYDALFWIYVLTCLTFAFLLVYGFMVENYTYLVISGFLSCLIGIALITIGFPLLTSNFLINSFAIIFIGIGAFLIIGSGLDQMEDEDW